MAKVTQKTVESYIAAAPEAVRADLETLHDLIRKAAPKLRPTMAYGMPGYGTYAYKYESGRTGESALVCMAATKAGISVYVAAVDAKTKKYLPELHAKELGKVSVGKSCIRMKRLADVHIPTLRKVLKAAAAKPPFPLL